MSAIVSPHGQFKDVIIPFIRAFWFPISFACHVSRIDSVSLNSALKTHSRRALVIVVISTNICSALRPIIARRWQFILIAQRAGGTCRKWHSKWRCHMRSDFTVACRLIEIQVSRQWPSKKPYSMLVHHSAYVRLWVLQFSHYTQLTHHFSHLRGRSLARSTNQRAHCALFGQWVGLDSISSH